MKTLMPNKPRTLVDLLSVKAETLKDQRVFTFLNSKTDHESILSFQELHGKAQSIAAALQESNLIGQRALLLYSDAQEFIVAFFGCLYAGVIAVPVQIPQSRQNNLQGLNAIVADAGISVILSTQKKIMELEDRIWQFDWAVNSKLIFTEQVAENLKNAWRYPNINSDSLAFLQYTSGSTGMPKGVMVSHGNLLHNQELIKTGFGNTQDLMLVGWLPLFHDMGLIGNVLQPIYVGGQAVLMTPMDFLQQPIRWLQAISKYRGNVSGGPNFAYELCANRITQEQKQSLDLRSWQVAFNGSERVSAATMQLFSKEFAECGFDENAFYPTYGLAETTLFASGNQRKTPYRSLEIDTKSLESNQIQMADLEQPKQEIVGCGHNWLDQKIIIADPKKLMQLDDNQIGEVWLNGPSVTKGYWNKPELTKEIFQACLNGDDQSSYLRTGDLGFIRNGQLYITGRLKDLIIIRGKNYYPEDIESAVRNSHDALRSTNSAAFSIEKNNEEQLIIIQEVNRIFLRKLNPEEVINAIRKSISAQFQLQVKAILLVKPKNIPLTTSGKIRRKQCASDYQNQKFLTVHHWNTENTVIQIQSETMTYAVAANTVNPIYQEVVNA